jgi:hypothetical protein
MKKVLVLVTILIAIHAGVFAQTKRESIQEMLRIMQQDSLMDKMISGMIPSLVANQKAFLSEVSPKLKVNATSQEKAKYQADQKKRDSIMAKADVIMKESMESAKKMLKSFMDNDMVDVYDRHFTHAEINDYIAFYKSPSGAKMLKIMPAVQKDIMSIMMQKYLPEMQKKIIERMKEISGKY